MGKVIVSISMTVDGFVDGENVVIDPEFFEFTHELMSRTTLAAFGRHTFEVFQERWPKRLLDPNTAGWMRRMAKALHDIPKVVFSSTLNATTWNNSTIVDRLDFDYINSFKQNSEGTLMTVGSPGLVEALTAMNMVDEYYFTVQPVIAGKGQVRFFDKVSLPERCSLKYMDCKQLANGAHIVHYENAGASSLR